MTLTYYRKIQKPRKTGSVHVGIPKAICDIMEIEKFDNVEISVSMYQGGRIMTLRKVPQTVQS